MPKPVLLTKWPKTKLADWWCDGREGQHADDDQHAEDVPPDADVVQQGDQPDAELVQHAVQQPARPRRPGSRAAGGPRSHCRSRKALMKNAAPKSMPAVTATWPEEVEPAGEPGPGRRRWSGPAWPPSSTGRPRSGSWSRPRPWPGPTNRVMMPTNGQPQTMTHRAAGVHAEPVQGQAAGQDRDDRERDGEVREARHPPAQLLGVAELVKCSSSLLIGDEDGACSLTATATPSVSGLAR